MPLEYVETRDIEGRGYYEIDTVRKVIRYRDITQLRPKDSMLHDWTEIYETIQHYIQLNKQHKFIKEVIPGIKFYYSTEPFCDRCNVEADVYKYKIPLCAEHANVHI